MDYLCAKSVVFDFIILGVEKTGEPELGSVLILICLVLILKFEGSLLFLIHCYLQKLIIKWFPFLVVWQIRVFLLKLLISLSEERASVI